METVRHRAAIARGLSVCAACCFSAFTGNLAARAQTPSFEKVLHVFTTPGWRLAYPSKSTVDRFTFQCRWTVHTPPTTVSVRPLNWLVRMWVWRDRGRCVLFAKISNGVEVYDSIRHGRVLDVCFRPGRHPLWVCGSGTFAARFVRRGRGLHVGYGFWAYRYPAVAPVALDLSAVLSPHMLERCLGLCYGRATGKLELEMPSRPTSTRVNVFFSRRQWGRHVFPVKMLDLVTRSHAGVAVFGIRFWNFRLGGALRPLAFHSRAGGLRRLGVSVKRIRNAIPIASAIYAPGPAATLPKLSTTGRERKAIFERWAGLTGVPKAAIEPGEKPGASQHPAGSARRLGGGGTLRGDIHDVPSDYAKAIARYRKAAEAGDGGAMCNIGVLYADGQGVPQNYAKAMIWFRRSARTRNGTAMRCIGDLYSAGWGVPQDYGKAMRWYRKSAATGDGGAMCNIGILYADGHSVARDYAKALSWYLKAAAAGYAPAMVNIGLMYFKGQGVSKNIAKATAWFKKAAAAGDPRARQALEELKELAPAAAQK